jgi:hypothetical protein
MAGFGGYSACWFAKIDCLLFLGMRSFENMDCVSARGRVETVILLQILQI